MTIAPRDSLPAAPSVIGKRICQLRKEKGWTQRFLASRCNMSPATIKRAEKGLVKEIGTISRIAAALDVAVVQLADESLKCRRCGDCCRQFIIKIPVKKGAKIDGPILFYNLHQNVHAYAQWKNEKGGDRELIVQIRERCSMLVEHADGTTACKLYWMRPPICRSFPQQGSRGPDIPQCSMTHDAVEASGNE